MVALLTALGIVLFFLGLLFSIAWHELGHLAAAKVFGIRCTQYMVGWGKTLWSFRRGDTEYGVKLLPVGGYVRMAGMIPPARERGETASGKPMSRWRAMIEDARAASSVELDPGDEDRQFYQRAPWKRVIVMLAGPAMNVVLAVVLFGIAMMGIGVQQPTTTVGEVSKCVVSSADADQTCAADAEPTPAAAAGFKAGDRIVAIDGRDTPDNLAASSAIRAITGPTTITVERGGERVDLKADLVENRMPKRDAAGNVVYRTDADGDPVLNDQGQQVAATETTGFLGVVFTNTRQPLTLGEAADEMGAMAVGVGRALVTLPSKVPGVFRAAFLGEERRIDSPVGIVGASRIGGEVLAQPVPIQDRAMVLLNLLAGVNMFLFAFNMVPLLPLDGGHILGALWESVRRGFAKLFKRPDPGPFDVAQLMPLAYVVFVVFACFSLMLLVADVVNPVRLT